MLKPHTRQLSQNMRDDLLNQSTSRGLNSLLNNYSSIDHHNKSVMSTSKGN